MRLALPTIALIITFLSSCSKYENFVGFEESTDDLTSKVTFVSSDAHNTIEAELFAMINNYRTSIGLNEMEFESTTYYYAGLHTDYMIENGTTSHVKFGERAENISKRTGAVFVAENVAKDYDTTTDAFEAWLDSPGHRKNLEGNFDYSAVSIKRNSNGDLYFTQVFFR
ncbi:CAP domain-containing protein [uncultured Maribacter sp.]|uniref:CAP domain-containing protein n=1 Tax=uncultured Maribacter sp. TaxID=431308 RepID=UPI0030D7CE5B|tara:strand:- start:7773 stop:8279 length:507 start_codon:yes stop_codon:yes gene_type:complete